MQVGPQRCCSDDRASVKFSIGAASMTRAHLVRIIPNGIYRGKLRAIRLSRRKQRRVSVTKKGNVETRQAGHEEKR